MTRSTDLRLLSLVRGRSGAAEQCGGSKRQTGRTSNKCPYGNGAAGSAGRTYEMRMGIGICAEVDTNTLAPGVEFLIGSGVGIFQLYLPHAIRSARIKQ